MGGGYYDRMMDESPAAPAATATRSVAWTAEAEAALTAQTGLHPDLSPKNRSITSDSPSPIVFAIDVTGSMGDFAKIIYEKMPMMFGQIILQGYLDDPEICFAAVGDANSDAAPLQVSDFHKGDEIDEALSKIWLEGGGGGLDHETYELAAYWFVNHCELTAAEKPFFFFTGDECYYPGVLPEHVTQFFGGGLDTAIGARDVFAQLKEKFNVFLIHKSYFDPVIDAKSVKKWAKVLGRDHILHVEDPRAIVDVVLGAIAVVAESRTLDGYMHDLEDRGQTVGRQNEVAAALASLSESLAAAKAAVTSASATGGPSGSSAGASNSSGGGGSSSKTSADPELAAAIESSLADYRSLVESLGGNVPSADETDQLRSQIAALRSGIEFPEDFICPITQEPFVDPVILESGNSYERSAIAAWFEDGNSTDPLTNVVLGSTALVPNHMLRKAVVDWVFKYGSE